MDILLLVYLVGGVVSWAPITIYVLHCVGETGNAYCPYKPINWVVFTCSLAGLSLSLIWPVAWCALMVSWLSVVSIRWYRSKDQ